jgi:ATP-dependent Zn protease
MAFVRRNVVWGLILIAVVAIVVAFFRPSTGEPARHDLSVFIDDARESRVARIEVRGSYLEVTLKDGRSYETRKEAETSVLTILSAADVDPGSIEISVQDGRAAGDWLGLLVQFLPILLFAALVYVLMKRAVPARQS